MRLIKLILDGYKPLLLNGIKEFTLTPNSMYQIILGTNGSGKSSVLKEANPMPASSSGFIKTGRKVSYWEHNDVFYILSSTFKGGNKHSFIKKSGEIEEELNEGGTGAVQKELIKQQFGLSSDVIELFTDNIKFTTMSPSKRREWLTSLCDTDFTFALNTFNKLKSLGRDAQGAYKHVATRLTKEATELERIGDLTEFIQLANLIREELNLLLQNKEHRVQNKEHLKEEIENVLSGIKIQSQRIILTLNKMRDNQFENKGQLQRFIQTLQSEYSSKEALLAHFKKDLSELQDLEETLSKTGFGGLESIKERLVVIGDAIQQLEGFETVFTETPEAIAVYKLTEEVLPNLIGLFNEMLNNEDNRFNRERLQEAKDKRSECKQHREKFLNNIAHLEHKIERFKQQDKTECPECQHTWIPGFTKETENQILSEIDKGNAEVKRLTEQFKTLEEYIVEAEEYNDQIKRLKYLFNSYPRLKNLWSVLIEKEVIFKNPKNAIPLVNQWLESVKTWVELQSLREEQEELTHAIEASTRIEGGFSVTERMSKLKTLVDTTTNELVGLKENLEVVEAQLDYVERVEVQYAAVCKSTDRLLELRKEYLNAARNSLIDHVTAKHQNRLAEIQRQCNEKETLLEIIKGLEKQRNDLEKDQKAYKLLVDTLSPTEGLIAEQLTGFIKSFTDHLNSIIERIWTYDLKVLPCGLDSGELDYKFPLQVKGEENPVNDVSGGSTGQCDVIDFAFKLIVMSYLKLIDFPLYLDELGSSFDEQHRINVMTFIKELMETGQFSQVFLISHYASSHGVFQQVETLVMDPTNIVVPNQYNNHVIMA